MGLLEPYKIQLNQLKDDIPLIAADIVESNSEIIIMILQDKQLGLGLNSSGQALSFTQGKYSGDGFYADATEILAEKENPRMPKISGNEYNFEWTGSTFDSMDLTTDDGGTFAIFTKDGKQRLLETLYGEIFDLTEAHNKFVNETIILPQLYKYIFNNMLQI